jgi:hypothetical protein
MRRSIIKINTENHRNWREEGRPMNKLWFSEACEGSWQAQQRQLIYADNFNFHHTINGWGEGGAMGQQPENRQGQLWVEK